MLTVFPAEDRAPAVKNLDLDFDSLPVKRALGIQWNVEQGMFNLVERYILNETKRFVTFVSNRIAKIQEGSDPSQWRHVRSELNPADLASRGIKVLETGKLERWTNGPEFLWQMETEWSQQPAELLIALQDDDEGVRKDKLT